MFFNRFQPDIKDFTIKDNEDAVEIFTKIVEGHGMNIWRLLPRASKTDHLMQKRAKEHANFIRELKDKPKENIKT
jgi:hypothetical protein